jgi:hypothetical protein
MYNNLAAIMQQVHPTQLADALHEYVLEFAHTTPEGYTRAQLKGAELLLNDIALWLVHTCTQDAHIFTYHVHCNKMRA